MYDEIDLSRLSNEDLDQQLYNEMVFYTEDLRLLCKLIRKQLPKKMVYRIISKLYRLRKYN